MSSILKALKKLEEEKADKKEGAANIARDILRTSRKAKKVENWILPTAVMALLLTGGMVAYFLAGGFSPDQGESEIAQVAAEVGQEEKTAGTNKDEMISKEAAAVAGVKKQVKTAAAVDRPEAVFAGPKKSDNPTLVKTASTGSISNVADSVEETARTQKETAAALKDTAKALKETAEALKEKVVFPKEVTVISSGSSGAAQSDKLQSKPTKSKGQADASRQESVQTALLPETAIKAVDEEISAKRVSENIYRPAKGEATKPAGKVLEKQDEDTLPRVMTLGTEPEKSKWTNTVTSGGFPDLTVSEIHYQWDVKNRLAVVNDLPVMEGTVIEGAKVDRILRDRVRFIYDGKYQEIKVRK